MHVATHEIRIGLRKLADDLHAWLAASWNEGELDLGTIAEHIADAHHRFQWIHPFQDTNGRTGVHGDGGTSPRRVQTLAAYHEFRKRRGICSDHVSERARE
jgi:Fic/DOC family